MKLIEPTNFIEEEIYSSSPMLSIPSINIVTAASIFKEIMILKIFIYYQKY